MAFKRFMFNNKTVVSLDGFDNITRRRPADMTALETYVKFWSRSYSTLTVGCEIFVCDSVYSYSTQWSKGQIHRPTILRASFWHSQENKEDPINFKICSSYGLRLENPEASFDELKLVSVIVSEKIKSML
jgi:hypothetical protein